MNESDIDQDIKKLSEALLTAHSARQVELIKSKMDYLVKLKKETRKD